MRNTAISAEILAEAIVETVPTPLLVLDRDLRVRTANGAFYRTFLVRPTETEGQLLYELGNGQWNIPALRRLLEELLPEQATLEGYEVTHAFPDIGTRTIVLNARRLQGGDAAQTPLLLLAMEDITERRATEERLARFTAELQRSNQALQEFAAVASHDLQEPLRKILSFGDRLETALGTDLNERARDSLTRMMNAARRMQALIEGLLQYSRVATRAQPFQSVDLSDVLREVLRDLETAVARAGGEVDAGELPTIDADPLQMRQVMQNLLVNSLKFHREGVAPHITITASDPDERGFVEITVRDNGIGFEEKHADKVFKVFQRLHGHGAYEGSGIGLAICKRIVERHGGEISATGTPNVGATFTIKLPQQQPSGDSQ